ncbi:hypothetical protein L6452_43789 [Arctium lappa]|uniref:Uncharacterized protein n=1 Tax=Arctium lappa TaxID=4217 RepID=A0ACB8XEK6_ARCLA|nr:hypothetical protein L6452_43789 [Arctium lappa]
MMVGCLRFGDHATPRAHFRDIDSRIYVLGRHPCDLNVHTPTLYFYFPWSEILDAPPMPPHLHSILHFDIAYLTFFHNFSIPHLYLQFVCFEQGAPKQLVKGVLKAL